MEIVWRAGKAVRLAHALDTGKRICFFPAKLVQAALRAHTEAASIVQRILSVPVRHNIASQAVHAVRICCGHTRAVHESLCMLEVGVRLQG